MLAALLRVRRPLLALVAILVLLVIGYLVSANDSDSPPHDGGASLSRLR